MAREGDFWTEGEAIGRVALVEFLLLLDYMTPCGYDAWHWE